LSINFETKICTVAKVPETDVEAASFGKVLQLSDGEEYASLNHSSHAYTSLTQDHAPCPVPRYLVKGE